MDPRQLPGERHGSVPGRHLAILHCHLEDPEGAADDDGGREQDVAHQTPGQYLLLQVTRRLLEDVVVNRFEAQALSWWSIHNHIDPQDLEKQKMTPET
jgi:hypothetical protein